MADGRGLDDVRHEGLVQHTNACEMAGLGNSRKTLDVTLLMSAGVRGLEVH